MLTLVVPAGLSAPPMAFALFRFFDAAEPAPVAWADGLWKTPAFRSRPAAPRRPGAGFAVLFDLLVAALCTLLVITLWKTAST